MADRQQLWNEISDRRTGNMRRVVQGLTPRGQSSSVTSGVDRAKMVLRSRIKPTASERTKATRTEPNPGASSLQRRCDTGRPSPHLTSPNAVLDKQAHGTGSRKATLGGEGFEVGPRLVDDDDAGEDVGSTAPAGLATSV